jgi:hypothetical protein
MDDFDPNQMLVETLLEDENRQEAKLSAIKAKWKRFQWWLICLFRNK